MSTVLDADRELRRRDAAAKSPDVAAPVEQAQERSWLRPVIVVTALAAGATALMLFLVTRETPLVPRLWPAQVAETPATSEQLARVPPLVAERGDREAPWGRVEKGSVAPPAAVPVPPPAARPLPPPAARQAPPPARVAAKAPAARRDEPAVVRAVPASRARAAKPAPPARAPATLPEEAMVPETATEHAAGHAMPPARPYELAPEEQVAPERPAVVNEAPAPAVREQPVAREVPAVADDGMVRREAPAREPVVSHAPKAAEPPPPVAPRDAPSSMGGTPRVRVSSISYTPQLNARSATVRINGGPAVTLREGESEAGVEVQLILKDAVYLRHGGNVFAVGLSR